MSRTHKHYKFYTKTLKREHPVYFKKHQELFDKFLNPPRYRY